MELIKHVFLDVLGTNAPFLEKSLIQLLDNTIYNASLK